jgi:hypothetical protein
LIASLAFVIAAAPAFAAAVYLIDPPVVASDDDDDDCEEHEDDDEDDDGKPEDDDDDDDDDDCPPATAGGRFIVESALLNGLEGNALYPFIDTTPNNITRAHIAIADATEACTAGEFEPDNIRVLVGVAGGTLVNVMTAATNTGIGDTRQCVFHVTIVPGADGVPSQVTDIVVMNAGEGPLTGVHTITVSAEVA